MIGSQLNDKLYGDQGQDTIEGRNGDDIIEGGDDRDVLDGGGGDDVLRGQGAVDDIDGSRGADLIEGGEGDDNLHAGSGNDTVRGGAGHDNIYGETGDDELHGAGEEGITSNDNDTIEGGSGRDTILGGFGSDLIFGGGANDEIHGGEGADRLWGNNGSDTIFGDGDADFVAGGPGSDDLDGGDGNDTIYAGDTENETGEVSRHTLRGGDGDDIIRGDSARDVIEGGNGDDDILAYGGDNEIDAGPGRDTVITLDGNDIVYGGTGIDIIQTNGGNDTIYGDDELESPADGADTIISGLGGDTIFGGGGDDTITSSDTASGNPNEAFVIQSIDAGSGNDTVYGDFGGDSVQLGAGNDSFFGYDGVDNVDGDAGNDLIYGHGAQDILSGGDGNDTLYGGDGRDILAGGNDADRLIGGLENDVINGGNGSDYIEGNEGSDDLSGAAGNDTILGGIGDDTLRGGSENDQLFGELGNDLLVGDFGDDTLIGGSQSDILWGGMEAIDESTIRNPLYRSLPPLFDAVEAIYPTGYVPPSIVPSVLHGNSHDGSPTDGRDDLSGDGGDDWLFGGGQSDTLSGGFGVDFVDAGVGNDTANGGPGDDIVFGGGNSDIVYGDEGIDQVYGNSGDDFVYGDAGNGADQSGQRLFGGGGIDNLYAYAPSALSTEYAQVGDQLFGGPGGDFIHGNVRREILAGDDGKDNIWGDILAGPTYGNSLNPSTAGGDDIAVGDGGEDHIYGGGGNDTLWGGPDSDRLEGQDGFDQLYGGGWIDVLVADVDPDYTHFGDSIDGHFGNREKGDRFDDNATDILLIEGTQHHDTIQIGETEVGIVGAHPVPGNARLTSDAQFSVSLNDADPVEVTIPAGSTAGNQGITDLRDSLNQALNVAGLFSSLRTQIAGQRLILSTDGQGRDALLRIVSANSVANHELGFSSGDVAVPLLSIDSRATSTSDGQMLHDFQIQGAWRDRNGTPLIEQFRVSGLNGNDTIRFREDVDLSDLIDRSNDWVGVFDGGPGHDILTGHEARDRLDGGHGDDLISGFGADDRLFGGPGHDTMYAGQGDDDLVGGSGHNTMFAWSRDPRLGADFGVFVDMEGRLFDSRNDASDLENTGINRMLGGTGDDELYAGTQVDFLYGAGGSNTIYSADGTEFEDMDGGLVGDAWKEYAKTNDQVWYVAGTGADDTIHVDLVTEPGTFQDRHLITRLTENNDNFTFAAQLRLSFDARDENDEQIWDASDIVFDVESLMNEDPSLRVSQHLEQILGEDILPPEGEYQVILIDALDGNDEIIIGPTVRKTVWIDAGPGDDVVEINSGSPILTDTTENVRRNDDPANAYVLEGAPFIHAPTRVISSNVLTADATFSIDVDGAILSTVTVLASRTDGSDAEFPVSNQTLTDLIADVRDALIAAGIQDRVSVRAIDGRLAFSGRSTGEQARLEIIANENDPAVTELGLATQQQAIGSTTIGASIQLSSLTLDHAQDVDNYAFTTGEDTNGTISVRSLSPDDGISLSVLQRSEAGESNELSSEQNANLDIQTFLAVPDQIDAADGNEERGSAYRLDQIEAYGKIRGLTLDSESDVDWFEFDLSYDDPAEVRSTSAVDLNLIAEAVFDVQVGDGESIGIQVPAEDFSSMRELVERVNASIDLANASHLVVAQSRGSLLTLSVAERGTASPLSVVVDAGNPAMTHLKLPSTTVFPKARMAITTLDATSSSRLELDILNANGEAIGSTLVADEMNQTVVFELAGLPIGSYFAHVRGTAAQRYELIPSIGVAANSLLDLSGSSLSSLDISGLDSGQEYILQVRSARAVPTVYRVSFEIGNSPGAIIDLGANQDVSRRDVILGGTGDDRLMGGPSEDWIFGGPGNDVISGGRDRQASDLLFGEDGDDDFQLIPDALPFLTGTTETFVPTFVDEIDGGNGNDRVLFQGGDIDRDGRPIPDFVALKYNRTLHRYELSNLVWDTANQNFLVDENIVLSSDEIATGNALSGDARFWLVVDGEQSNATEVVIPADATAGDIDSLVSLINNQLSLLGLSHQVEAGRFGQRLEFRRVGGGGSINIASPNRVADIELHLVDTLRSHESGRQHERQYIFYQTDRVEGSKFDMRAGDDVVRAGEHDGGEDVGSFKFHNDDGSWGIAPSDRPQRGLVSKLEIFGGDGADHLVGGSEDDYIDGGPGDDFIFGLYGDDELVGGGGNDRVFGRDGVQPDRYEIVPHIDSSASNDTFEFASPLDYISAGTAVGGLTFHHGDEQDWYILPLPVAFDSFGNRQTAVITESMIEIEFDLPSDRDAWSSSGAREALSLLPARLVSRENEPIEVVPISDQHTLPDYYLLSVENPRYNADLGTIAEPSEGNYSIRIVEDPNLGHLGDLINVTAGEWDFETESSLLNERGTAIPIGDINGDGYDDVIASVRESYAVGETTLGRVLFGSVSPVNTEFTESSPLWRTFEFPAPLRSPSTHNIRSEIISAGDLNDDGISDIAVSVSSFAPAAVPIGGAVEQGVYILFGRANWDPITNIVDDADVVIGNVNGNIALAAVGDVHRPAGSNASIDDLLIGERPTDPNAALNGAAYLFNGRSDWMSEIVIDMEDPTTNIVFENDSTNYANGLWHRTTNRGNDLGHSSGHSLYFGRDLEADYDVGPTSGKVTLPPIDLEGIFDGTFSFNYFLHAERPRGNIGDVATVRLEFSTGSEAVFNNRNNATLDNRGGGWKKFETSLAPFADGTGTVTVSFEFETGDEVENDFEGWYIDDVAITPRYRLDKADVVFETGEVGDRLGDGVAGIDDLNGDNIPEFAIWAGDTDGVPMSKATSESTVYIFYGRQSDPPLARLVDPATLANLTVVVNTNGDEGLAAPLLPAGDIDGNGYPDLIVTDSAKSHLILGVPNGAIDVGEFGAGRPLGDINGDGLGDVAAVVSEDDAVIYPILLGGSNGFDMLVRVQTTSDIVPASFQSVGDVNGDSIMDVAASQNGSRVGFILGQSSHAFSLFDPNRRTPEQYRFELAPNVPTRLSEKPNGVQLGDLAPNDIDEAVRISPPRTDQQMTMQPVGDFNGDGFEDILASVQDRHSYLSYLLFGPTTIDDHENIAERAAITFENLGTPAKQMGDLDGDGADDLVFVAPNIIQSLGQPLRSSLHIVYGSNDLLGTYTRDIVASRPKDRVLTLASETFTGEGQSGFTATVGNFVETIPGEDELVLHLESPFRLEYCSAPQPNGTCGVFGEDPIHFDEDVHTLILDDDGLIGSLTVADLAIESIARVRAAETLTTTMVGVSTIGDVNGDGLDDLAFHTSDTVPRATPRGRVSVLLGKSSDDLDIRSIFDLDTDDMDAELLRENLGHAVVGLGDINRDGYDDFAIRGETEDSSQSSLELYHGSATINLNSDRSVRRVATDELAGVSFEGDLEVAAGDFNGDGETDLAIGEPSRRIFGGIDGDELIDEDAQGHVYLFWSVENRDRHLILADADLRFDSVPGVTGFGGLPISWPHDLDSDNYDDLVVRTSPPEQVFGPLAEITNSTFILHGSPTQVLIPSSDDVEPVTNETVTGSGDFVEGHSGAFEIDVAESVTGPAWRQFTTLGDGKGGNFVSVSPMAEPARSLLIPVRDNFDEFGNTTTPFLIGGTNHGERIEMELDLASLLPYLDDLDAVTSVKLQLEAEVTQQNLPDVTYPVLSYSPSDGGRPELWFVESNSPTSRTVWRSDGTAAGTDPIENRIASRKHLDHFTQVGTRIYFFDRATTTNQAELWYYEEADLQTSNPTSQRVASIDAAQTISPSKLHVLGDDVYFVATNADGFQFLYRVDSSLNTMVVANNVNESFGDFSTGDDRLFYSTTDGAGAIHFYSIAAGENAPTHIRQFSGVTLTSLLAVGQRLYTVLEDGGSSQHTLFSSDGSDWRGIFTLNASQRVSNLTKLDGRASLLVSTGSTHSVMLTDGHSFETLASVTGVTVDGASFAIGVPSTDGRDELLFSLVPSATASLKRLYRYDSSGEIVHLGSIPQTVDEASEVVRVGSSIYIADNDQAAPFLFKIIDDNLVTTSGEVGDQFRGLTSSLGNLLLANGSQLDMTSGVAASISLTPVSENAPFDFDLQLTILDPEGDLVINQDDAISGVVSNHHLVDAGVWYRSKGAIRAFALDISQAAKEFVLDGKTRMTVGLQVPSADTEVRIDRSSMGAATGVAIEIARQDGYVMDLFDEHGGRLAEAVNVADLRNYEAGTFFTRIYNPFQSTTDDAARLRILAPEAGESHPSSDRDLIRAGDGDDTLIGGAQLDRLFGESGLDRYVGQVVEVANFQTDEDVFASSGDDHFINQPRATDNEVVIVNPVLQAIFAEKLGIPSTIDFNGDVLYHEPFMASELNTLTRLDAVRAGISDLTGSQYATNLRSVNLVANEIGDLTPIRSANLEGESTGWTNVEHLALDGVAATSLGPLTSLGFLQTLSIDQTVHDFDAFTETEFADMTFFSYDSVPSAQPATVPNTDFLSNMPQLRWLSIMGQGVDAIPSVLGLQHIEHVQLQNNRITDIAAFAGERLIDNGNLLREESGREFATPSYSETGEWIGSVLPSELAIDGNGRIAGASTDIPFATTIPSDSVVFNGNYRFAPAGNGDRAAHWHFRNLPNGSYEVLATWFAGPNHAFDARYDMVVEHQEIESVVSEVVDQRAEPSDEIFANRPWDVLGTLDVDNGKLEVRLSDLATTGIIVADAIRIRRATPHVIDYLHLDDNPLDNAAHDGYLSLIESQGSNVTYGVNDSRPSISPIAPVTLAANATSITVDLQASDDDGDDVDYTAFTGHRGVIAEVTNNDLLRLRLQPGFELSGAVQIYVTAHDRATGGRTDDTIFHLVRNAGLVTGQSWTDNLPANGAYNTFELPLEGVQITSTDLTHATTMETHTDVIGRYTITDLDIASPHLITQQAPQEHIASYPTDPDNHAVSFSSLVLDGLDFGSTPVITAVSVIDVDENSQTTLTGNLQNTTGDPMQLSIDWGDGNVDVVSYPASAATFTETHVYVDDPLAANDRYPIHVTLSEQGNVVATTTEYVRVLNLPPTAIADVISFDDRGTLIGANGLLTNDQDPSPVEQLTVTSGPNGAPVGQPFEIVSGAFVTLQANGNVSFDPGERFVHLGVGEQAFESFDYEISDGDGGSSDASVSIAIVGANDEPVVEALDLSAAVIDEAGTLSIVGSFTDIDRNDSHTVSINWGDGQSSAATLTDNTFTATHAYALLHLLDGDLVMIDVVASVSDNTTTSTRSAVLSVAGYSDGDSDGVRDSIEDGAANNGDGNNDGVQDRTQSNVASLPNAIDGTYVTIESPTGTSLSTVEATDLPTTGPARPAGLEFPLGLISYEVNNVAAGPIQLSLHHQLNLPLSTFYKFGPTDSNPSHHYYEFLYNESTGLGAQVVPGTIVLHLQDGAVGDNDLTANGQIVDPVAFIVSNGPAADFSFTDEDEPVIIDLLSNDRIDGPLAIAEVTQPENGHVVIDGGSTVRYTPAPDYFGFDSFDYYYLSVDGVLGPVPVTVEVRPVEDLPGGVLITPITELRTTESGSSAQFSVVLTQAPNSSVIIPIASSDPGEGVTSVDRVIFTPENWNVAQAISVRGVDDFERDGDQTYTITTSGVISDAESYAGISVPDVELINEDNDAIPPTVSDILVGSTSWSETFRTNVLGNSGGFYRIPSGQNQFASLPWQIDQVRVVFSEPVNVESEDMVMTSVHNGFISPLDFEYDVDSNAATWTIPPIDDDKLLLNLSDRIVSVQAGLNLDGDFEQGTSLQNSGDNIAGGVFRFQFNVLRGDVNQSGAVAVNDLGAIRTGLGASFNNSGYSMFADTNGSGGIAVDDVVPLREKLGSSIPEQTPRPFEFSPAPAVGLEALLVDAIFETRIEDDLNGKLDESVLNLRPF